MEYFLPKGHEILIIDNFATGKREALPEIHGLEVVEGSINDDQLVNECFGKFKPTHVIHSAASYKDPSDWREDSATNILGTINVAKASLDSNVCNFINFQTALCYGRPKVTPIPVDHGIAPFTSYGISKSAGEAYLLQSDLDVISLRLANICGPRLAIGPIPTFYQRLKDGKSCFCSDTTRDFLDMSDFLSLVDMLFSEKQPAGVYNVSTGVGSSIKDVFDAVAKYLGMTPPEVPIVEPGEDDVPVVVLDPSETENTIGWRAEFSFEEIIYRQLEWYDAHGINDIFSHLAAPKT